MGFNFHVTATQSARDQLKWGIAIKCERGTVGFYLVLCVYIVVNEFCGVNFVLQATSFLCKFRTASDEHTKPENKAMSLLHVYLIAERLSARLLIVQCSQLTFVYIYIYISVTL